MLINRNTILTVFLALLLVLLTNNYSFAQKKGRPKVSTENNSTIVIAKVGNEDITWGQIEHAFQKNISRKNTKLEDIPKDSIVDFIKLYTDYRLKVQDATGRGFEKDSSVIEDIKQYRRILAESYYYDKELIEPNITEMLEFRKSELQFAYILIALDPQGMTDTVEAYRKAVDIMNRVKAGENFATLAMEFSDDKESGRDGGSLFDYFTSGKITRTIERALYSIKNPGEVYPEPVRTKYGYFILKLLRKEPRKYVLASHILLSEGLDKDSVGVIKKSESLIKQLKDGANFTRLAELHSDDPGTAIKGGKFHDYYSRSTGFLNSGKKIAKIIEDAMFSLKDGEITDKVFSEYGVHIIKRDSTKEIDVELEKDELRKTYKRLYFEEDKQVLLERLKHKYGFQVNYNTLNQILAEIDTTKTNQKENWDQNISPSLRQQKLFQYLKRNVSAGEFLDLFNNQTEFRGMATNTHGFLNAINRYATPEIFDQETKNLEPKYPDFAQLMKEFRDGILLFKVEAIEVWDKLKFDTLTAKKFWDTTRTKYRTDLTYDLTEIYVLSDSLANIIYQEAIAGKDFEELAEIHTQRTGYREKKGNWGKVDIKRNKLAAKVSEFDPKPSYIIKPFAYEKGYSIIRVNEVFPVREKTFEEAISDFAPLYQDQMQKYYTENWLKKVREKYPVKIFYDRINEIFKS